MYGEEIHMSQSSTYMYFKTKKPVSEAVIDEILALPITKVARKVDGQIANPIYSVSLTQDGIIELIVDDAVDVAGIGIIKKTVSDLGYEYLHMEKDEPAHSKDIKTRLRRAGIGVT